MLTYRRGSLAIVKAELSSLLLSEHVKHMFYLALTLPMAYFRGDICSEREGGCLASVGTCQVKMAV